MITMDDDNNQNLEKTQVKNVSESNWFLNFFYPLFAACLEHDMLEHMH